MSVPYVAGKKRSGRRYRLPSPHSAIDVRWVVILLDEMTYTSYRVVRYL